MQMKAPEFHDENHARRYLSGSVILFGGEPHFISDVYERINDEGESEGLCLVLLNMVDRRSYNQLLADKKFDFKSVPLGMVNLTTDGTSTKFKAAAYASRIPSRTWSVGVSRGTLKTIPISTGKAFLSTRNLIRSKELAAAILGNYPTLEKCRSALGKSTAMSMKSKPSMAFCRNFALDTDNLIYYKNFGIVGIVVGDTLALLKSKSFLRETVLEDAACTFTNVSID